MRAGEVADERVDAIAESLDFSVQGIGPLPITFTGFGAFPAPERARVPLLVAEQHEPPR